jgi:hypothetical protein
VQTRGWQRVTPRQSRLLLGFTIAAILGAGPTFLFCAVTVAIFAMLLALALTILLIVFVLFLLRLVRR